MASHFWLAMLAIQVALSIGATLAVYGAAPELSPWLAIPIGVGAFVLLQYLVVAMTFAMSRAPDVGQGSRPSLLGAIRAELTEPLYFGLAQLSMIGTTLAAKPTGCRLQRDAACPSPLLLVHGIACNAGVWRWLIPRLRAAGFDCIHTLSLEPLRADIDRLAEVVAREVVKIHSTHQGSRVTIVAHSMGGLVARAALRALDPATIRQLVTIGTPHHGATIAGVLSWPCARQMCTASRWLKSLNLLQEDHLSVPTTSIFSPDDNFVSPATSPRLRGARLEELRGLGHFGLLMSPSGIDSVLRAVKEVP
jgi:pimeloyl-ACP methyl ester carboxylesterase